MGSSPRGRTQAGAMGVLHGLTMVTHLVWGVAHDDAAPGVHQTSECPRRRTPPESLSFLLEPLHRPRSAAALRHSYLLDVAGYPNKRHRGSPSCSARFLLPALSFQLLDAGCDRWPWNNS